MMRCSILLFLFAGTLNLLAQSGADEREAWNRPVKPFRILGNIYYVGASGVASFLITSSKGAILLDGGFAETAPLIAKSVKELGFGLKDIKYLLNSHAYYDHCGGLAELQSLSGAFMIASEGDSEALKRGHQVNFGSGKDIFFPPVRVKSLIRNHETVQLGEVTLTAHLTPGRTKGCTTWTTEASANGKIYHVVFYGGTSAAGNRLVNNQKYPQIATAYEHSFAELRKLPCDVFLAPHCAYFHCDEKRARLAAGEINAFVDSSELQKFVDDSEQSFRWELDQQQANRQ
jgi:metallo-beta-lactamase class B